MKQIWVILCAAAGFLIGWNSAKSQDSARFDHLVRNDFFAGLMGDQGALDRAMAKTESVLASNPDHAEALVWHGAGLLRRSGLHFEKGDFRAGQDLWAKGISEMNRAVELEPDNVGVRIPRGATYLAVSRFVPPEMGKPLLETGLSDYEQTLEMQREEFDQLGEHPRGELLFGLAEGYARHGRQEQARAMFQRLKRELPGTEYARRAETWLSTGKLSAEQLRCVGCHTK